MRPFLCSLGATLALTSAAMAQPCGPGLSFQLINGFTGSQVGVAGHPTDPDTVYFLGLTGTVRIFRNGSLLTGSALTVSGFGSTNAGYGFTIDPDFATNGYIYIFGPTGMTSSLVRYTRSSTNPDVFDPASRTVLLVVPASPSQHTGGWIAFGPDGYLYLGLGDHFTSSNSQNQTNWLGKLLRIDVRSDGFPSDSNRNYAIPATNPFISGPFASEVFAIGLRNPFRSSFDSATGDLYIADVGQSRREEVDVLPAGSPGGQNFGWPCREGLYVSTSSCSPLLPVLTDPVIDFERTETSCILGGTVYHGSQIPWLQGRYIFGSCSGSVAMQSFVPANPRQTLQSHSLSITLYCIGTNANGELFVGTSNNGGRLVATPPPNPDCNANSKSDACEIASHLETDYNANAIPDSCERVCIADWNVSGVADANDIFDFLNTWMQAYLAADVNHDGVSTTADIFDFLNIWFSGCH